MSITAKRIDAAGVVTTIQLPDDPSDTNLIEALCGKDDDLVIRGRIKSWEILATTQEGSDTLIIGQPPNIGTFPKQRMSCTLTDEQVNKLVKLVDEGWRLLD